MRVIPLVLALLLLFPASAAAGSGSTDAVVLVSGFTTSTPFSTSAPACAGREGETWSPSVAPALKAAGLTVFTAPEDDGGDAPAPCVGSGQAAPPANTTIDTGGDVDDNGAALARLLAFLRDNYGVRTVQLVGHSDGGIWSRAAITQASGFAGVRVGSLTTLGTPHTGAFVADVIEAMNGATCDFSDELEELLCEALQDVVSVVRSELGPTAIAELTNSYMSTWNPKQSIGSCAVTVIAGDHVNIPLIGWLLPQYYNRSDTLVGVASALAQSSSTIEGTPIPAPGFANLVNGGTFDVVHSASLSFIDPANLLNQDAIDAAVLAAVRAGQASSASCNGSSSRAAGRRPEAIGLPLRSAVRVRGAVQTHRGDLLVARRAVRAACGSRSLGTDAPGSRRAVLVPLPECGRLRVSGGSAVLLRSDPHRRLSLTVSGSRLRVTKHGAGIRGMTLQRRAGSRWRTLGLDERGRATLPAGEDVTRVRVLVQVGRGPLAWATATLDR